MPSSFLVTGTGSQYSVPKLSLRGRYARVGPWTLGLVTINEMLDSLKTKLRSAIGVTLVLSVVGGAQQGVAQELAPGRIDVSELGPQVGEIVPDFSLPDQRGRIWTRDSIMGPAGAMLVFVRSADW